MKHPSDEQLVFCHYRETDEWRAVEAHLASCEPCRKRYDALCRVLSAVPAMPVPERSAGYGREIWRRLRPRLEQRPVSFLRRFFETPGVAWPLRWSLAPTVAALVVAAFLGGVFWSHWSSTDALAAKVREEIRGELSADLQTALNRSQELSSNALAALEARLARGSGAQARELVQALTETFSRAREEDRQAVLALLRSFDEAHAATLVALRKELEVLASQTDAQMRQARLTLAQLPSMREPTNAN